MWVDSPNAKNVVATQNDVILNVKNRQLRCVIIEINIYKIVDFAKIKWKIESAGYRFARAIEGDEEGVEDGYELG